MSTWIYLTCESHTPPLRAESESEQHLYGLPQIQEDIANRETLTESYQKGMRPAERFRRNTQTFLAEHPECRIGIIDEYGRYHPTSPKGAPNDR